MAIVKPKLWEVWDLNQVNARANTNPKQPLDPKEPARKYLCIADPLQRQIITCCPIQEYLGVTNIKTTEVELIKGYGGFITKDCKIICHEIYTLDYFYFTNHVGTLLDKEQLKVGDALYEFLKV